MARLRLFRGGGSRKMGTKMTVGICGPGALGCAAGGLYWVAARASKPLPEVVSPEPPGFQEALLANPQPNAKPGKSSPTAGSKKNAPPAVVELALKTGAVQ